MVTQKRILRLIIADDHPVFRSGMESAIKSMGFVSKISQAANGEEVIKLLDHEQYDIVLMDIKMSPMDGMETTEIIRARYPKTKVIALSMHSDEKHILEMLDKGAVGYLIKNANKEDIEEALTDVMDGRTYFSKQVAQIMYEQINRTVKGDINANKTNILIKERFRDIMFLIGQELTSEEIANILCLSTRTIEDYRKQILELTKSKSTVGVVKYSVEHGILNDQLLKDKFSKALSKKG